MDMQDESSSGPCSALPSRNHQPHAKRYEPSVVYMLAEYLKQQGIKLHNTPGPWRPLWRLLRRPGRNAEQAIPVVSNGVVDIAVDTAEHAVDVSGFLNLSGVYQLDPIPNLRPPQQDLLPA